jgi:hypothetical protein
MGTIQLRLVQKPKRFMFSVENFVYVSNKTQPIHLHGTFVQTGTWDWSGLTTSGGSAGSSSEPPPVAYIDRLIDDTCPDYDKITGFYI